MRVSFLPKGRTYCSIILRLKSLKLTSSYCTLLPCIILQYIRLNCYSLVGIGITLLDIISTLYPKRHNKMTIPNVKIIDLDKEIYADVTIKDKQITNIKEIKPKKNHNSTKIIMPPLIDLNVNVKDALLNGETMDEVAKAACKGGVFEIALSPESTPAVDNEIALEFIQSHNKHLIGARCQSIINSTNGNKELSNIAILLKRGAAAVFMSTKTDNILTTKIAQYVKMYDVTLFCRAEDKSLSRDGVMNEGKTSSKLGLPGVSAIGELLHVSRMIEIARYYNIRVLFQSITSPKSVELITKAKKEGVDVRCEVSIHHLLCSDEMCENFNTTAKIYPPLQSRQDMKTMQKMVANGEIDVLTTLHRPSSAIYKEVAFADASYGCESIEHALPLYYTKLIKENLITFEDLVKLCVINPAKLINKPLNNIQTGTKEFVLFDTQKSFVVSNKNSLYNLQTLHGEISVCK